MCWNEPVFEDVILPNTFNSPLAVISGAIDNVEPESSVSLS